MARPRLPVSKLTQAAIWKRAHRDHVGYRGAKPGNKGDKPVGGRCSKCGRQMSQGVSVHNPNHTRGSLDGPNKLVCTSCHNKER
jgi:hypothetical protein